jgi:hypothetical protein
MPHEIARSFQTGARALLFGRAARPMMQASGEEPGYNTGFSPGSGLSFVG